MGKLTIRDALAEVETDRWKCDSCDAPAEQDGKHCYYCRTYWEDVRNGLFDDYPAGRATLTTGGDRG